MTPYRAPRWLPGGHSQTIYPLLIKPAAQTYRRERWETPDGDFIDLDWNDVAARGPSAAQAVPLVLLFHGLEGNSHSHYARSLMRALSRIGWAGVVMHFRGCSGAPNRLPRAYHSGDSDEVDWILRRIRSLHPHRPFFAVGVSLGGNVLLKWLGEHGSEAAHVIDAAAAVSAPVDLAACGHNLALGFNRVYGLHFLNTLKPGATERLRRFPGLFDARRLHAARTLHAFDDAVTAPLHGFAGADDYWRRASSKPWLGAIRVPTLLLNALNDPFLPASALPRSDEVGTGVHIEFPAHGGHVGFVTGKPPGTLDWLPRRLIAFFTFGH